ncbi:MAG: hypothetical protein LIP16_10825 [Clostridium sp.]|nr:hypothetical protein [Clostridium sp.]
MEIKAPSKLVKEKLDEFKLQLSDALESVDKELLVDMSETNYISFAALLHIQKIHSEMKENSRILILKNVTGILAEVMEVTGFGSMLIIG